MHVDVGQRFVIGVQVEHHVRRSRQLHQFLLPFLDIGGRLRHRCRLVKATVEVMPGGIVKAPQNPPLAKLADTQRVGLWHHGDSALESAFGFGHRKALHQ
ncbi:hypothetical protein D3C71_1843790 [compost metagenome]